MMPPLGQKTAAGVGGVSVVIATWNRSAAVGEAVLSALRQSCPPLEVLVCDDGSTDETEQVIRAIGDERVLWLPGARAGRPAVPRNRGIRRCRGEWIAFLDDDDQWLPRRLEAQLEALSGSGCLACCGNAVGTSPDGESAGLLLEWVKDRVTFADLLGGNRVVCSSALVHRSVLDDAVGFPEHPGLKAMEDYAFWLRVSTLTDFAFVREPLLSYLDSPHTSIRAASADPFRQRRMVLADFLAWGCSYGKWSYIPAALASYLQAWRVSLKKGLTGR